jgi:hypothetical protein
LEEMVPLSIGRLAFAASALSKGEESILQDIERSRPVLEDEFGDEVWKAVEAARSKAMYNRRARQHERAVQAQKDGLAASSL